MRDPTAPSLVRLPEDMVLEILARVPGVADLFRCAVARKRWRALVTKPSFLRRRWPEDTRHRSSLVGFFGQDLRQRRGGEDDDGHTETDSCFVRAPRSVLGPGRPLLGSFVPGAASVFDDRVVPLASHRGALLVRFSPRGGAEPGVDRLAVCSLLSGACHVLPPLHCGWFFDYLDTGAHAVLTGADCFPDGQQQQALGPAFFKVLVVGVSEDLRHYVLRTFSSGETGWSAPSECFDPVYVEPGIFGPFKRRSAVVSYGTAHWVLWDLAKFHVLDMNAATGRASLQMLPTPPPGEGDLAYQYGTPHLTVAPNKTVLSSLCLLSLDLQVEIWTRRDGREDCAADWRRDRVVDMKPPERNQTVDGPWSLCSGERSGTLLVADRCQCMYILYLESGAMEEVTDHLRGLRDYNTAMAVEIDWPTFFACRLLGGKTTSSASVVGSSVIQVCEQTMSVLDILMQSSQPSQESQAPRRLPDNSFLASQIEDLPMTKQTTATVHVAPKKKKRKEKIREKENVLPRKKK